MTTIYESYQNEIRKIRRRGNALMKEIKQHENMMNQKKQRKLPTAFEDCYKLHSMVTTVLQMLAFIESYKYFQLQNIPLVDQFMDFFYQMTNYNYQSYIQSFMLKLRQSQSVDFNIETNINY